MDIIDILSPVITITNPATEVVYFDNADELLNSNLDRARVLVFKDNLNNLNHLKLSQQGFKRHSETVFYRRQISLCIPTMRRWNFLKMYLPRYLENPYIHEIIITDETGEDAELIMKHIASPRIKVYINEKRMYAFYNKIKAVSLATLPFVCLMDSDNFANIDYFNAWSVHLNGNEPDEMRVYSPSYTKKQNNHPGFNFSPFLGTVVTFDNRKEIYRTYPGAILFNTGNYMVSRKLMLDSQPSEQEKAELPLNGALDVLCQNYLILKQGGSIVVVEHMSYNHLVHEGSFYMASQHDGSLGEPSINKHFE